MRLLIRVGIAAALVGVAAALGLLPGSPTRAQDADCPPDVTDTVNGSVTVEDDDCTISGTVHGNVFVTAGGTLTVDGGTVNGKIEATSSGDVEVNGDAEVNGPIVHKGSGDVTISSGTVNGDVLHEGTGDGDVIIRAASSPEVNNVIHKSSGRLLLRGAKVRGNVEADGPEWVRIESSGTSDSVVGGDIKIKGTTGKPSDSPLPPFFPDQRNHICKTVVGGNIQLEENSDSAPFVVGETSGDDCGAPNTVDGHLQATKNEAGLRIEDNIIGGNLQAVENKTGGADLTIEGNTVGTVGTAPADLQAFKNDATGDPDGTITISDNGVSERLQCKENEPAPTGSGNTAGIAKEDQCEGL